MRAAGGMSQPEQPGTGVGLATGVTGTIVTVCVITLVCPGSQPSSPSTHTLVCGIVHVAVDSGHRYVVLVTTSVVTRPLAHGSLPWQSLTVFVLVVV